MVFKALSKKQTYQSVNMRPASRRRLGCLGFCLIVPFVVPTIWFTHRLVQSWLNPPDAILVLGGATQRERYAAEFALQHPDLPIWVSSGDWPASTRATFARAGISPERLHLDRNAVDTVTNFTTLADEFQRQGVEHVYLITSDYHMRRAQVVGEIVFGSRGILLKPIAVASGQSKEPTLKVVRDAGRSVLWVFTGRTGSTLGERFNNLRPD